MLNYSEKPRNGEPPKASDTDVHSRISNQLQTYYNEVLTQPLPQRFEDLLKRLDEQSGSEGEARS
ncbi:MULTISPECIES: NepR family anti-sigma factor [unclassified Stappia]|jgi:hypothetical protein|uniref:NepR family anti-sigma factor n=1 Tax=Stappia sp. 28M-7 TaxID=2762596 RepID=UPI000E70CC7C|nr:hypothetical protein [Stappia sp. 28M-7]